jgi:hypothetical protein
MKKYLLIFALFTVMPLICNSQSGTDCGFTGEADRSGGTQSCFNGCFNGYERCESFYNDRYQEKLEDLFYESLDDICRRWMSRWTIVPIEGPSNGVCDIYAITADIDAEHWINIAIAINFLNRCVNTCDGH